MEPGGHGDNIGVKCPYLGGAVPIFDIKNPAVALLYCLVPLLYGINPKSPHKCAFLKQISRWSINFYLCPIFCIKIHFFNSWPYFAFKTCATKKSFDRSYPDKNNDWFKYCIIVQCNVATLYQSSSGQLVPEVYCCRPQANVALEQSPLGPAC